MAAPSASPTSSVRDDVERPRRAAAGRHARSRCAGVSGEAVNDRQARAARTSSSPTPTSACRRSRLRPTTDEHRRPRTPRRGQRRSLSRPSSPTIVLRARRASDRRLDAGPARDGRADGRARPRARRRRSSGCTRTRCGHASSSRSARRSTSTRCSPAAPRRPSSLPGVAGARRQCRAGRRAAHGLRRPRRPSTGTPSAGAVGGPPDGSRVRAVGISYHYAADGDGRARRSGRRSRCRSSPRRAPRVPDRVRAQRGASGGGQRTSRRSRRSPRHTGPAIESARRRERRAPAARTSTG